MKRPPINVTDRQIEQMLRARSAHPPHHLLDTILEAAAIAPQDSRPWRRWLGQLRTDLAPLAVAIVIAALIGGVVTIGTVLRRPADSVGGPSEARQLPVAFDWIALEPGRYRIDSRFYTPVPFTFAVPSGWAAENHGHTINKFANTSREVGWVSFVLNDVYHDACSSDDREVRIGSAVDDLMQALIDQAGPIKSAPVDVTIDGHPGKRIELTPPSRFDADDCRFDGGLQLWNDPVSYQQVLLPDGAVSVYAVDVRGERVVIVTEYRVGSSAVHVAELEAVIDSIRFDD